MTAPVSVVEVTFESALRHVEMVEDITRRVSASAGFEEDDRHKIEVAVHELVINAIWHGNKSDASRLVWMRFHIFSDRLEIHIRDQGSGFDPGGVPDPLDAQNLLKVSGRGIFLIRRFMDDFRVEHMQGLGTEVTIVKRFGSRIQPSQGGTDREHEGNNTSS